MVNVSDIKSFYHSKYGKIISKEVRVILNSLTSLDLNRKTLFVGFGNPYINQNKKDFLLMFAHMGVYPWPNQEKNKCILAFENEWPFADQEFDEIIIIHGIEYAYNSSELISECYRCLKGEGKLIVIAANRRSVWAHSHKTPLGYGQPYTLTQIANLLKKESFVLSGIKRALYKLPFSSFYGKTFSILFEQIAKIALQKFSGLVGVVAIKQTYSGVKVKKNFKFSKNIIPVKAGVSSKTTEN